ncbi:hypothetical protein C8F01DRAFT_1280404, partial [Mycena amicta]
MTSTCKACLSVTISMYSPIRSAISLPSTSTLHKKPTNRVSMAGAPNGRRRSTLVLLVSLSDFFTRTTVWPHARSAYLFCNSQWFLSAARNNAFKGSRCDLAHLRLFKTPACNLFSSTRTDGTESPALEERLVKRRSRRYSTAGFTGGICLSMSWNMDTRVLVVRPSRAALTDVLATHAGWSWLDPVAESSLFSSPAMEPGSPKSIALSHAQQEQIQALARSMSRTESLEHLPQTTLTESTATATASQHSHTDPDKLINPFAGVDVDETLDPRSQKFDINAWLKSVMQIASRDPENFRSAGVSFRNLNVHGVGSPTDYQKNVANIWLGMLGSVKGWIGMGTGKSKIQILRDFDGIVKSGELLVVLGRPGRPQWLLDIPQNYRWSNAWYVASWRFQQPPNSLTGFTVDPASDIQYQGIPKEVMHDDFRGEVIYNAETDVHFPHLTVGQTLLFAAKARVPRIRLGGVARDTYAAHLRDLVMTIFGLSHTIDTKVGNDFVRGVQWWRTLARFNVGTTAPVVSTARLHWTLSEHSACRRRLPVSTAMVAIYQASQNAFDVASSTRPSSSTGPTDLLWPDGLCAGEFWTSRGVLFVHPAKTTGDVLTSLTNTAERIVAPGWENRVPRTAEEFAKVWRESAEYQTLLKDIEEYNNQYPLNGEALQAVQAVEEASAVHVDSRLVPLPHLRRGQILALHGTRMAAPYEATSLPFILRYRIATDSHTQLTEIQVFGNFIMALLISSVFYNLSNTTNSFYSRGALLFYAVLVNAFASALEIFTLYAQRPIVEKHNSYALYHPFAEAVSSMICDLPAKFLTATVVNLTLYFMTNLRREPGAFFIFYLFSYLHTGHALTPAAIFILGLIMYTGFTVPVRNMVVWFRWINYINPVGYAFESLMVNEFSGRTYPCGAFIPVGPAYANVSAANRICSTPGAKPGNDFVLGADYLATSFSYVHSHLWRNFGILIGYMIVFCATHLIATEYISAAKSKGEVLVFIRGYMPHKRKEDPENAAFSEKPASGKAPAKGPT